MGRGRGGGGALGGLVLGQRSRATVGGDGGFSGAAGSGLGC